MQGPRGPSPEGAQSSCAENMTSAEASAKGKTLLSCTAGSRHAARGWRRPLGSWMGALVGMGMCGEHGDSMCREGYVPPPSSSPSPAHLAALEAVGPNAASVSLLARCG